MLQGQVWEAAMLAAHYNIEIDGNKIAEIIAALDEAQSGLGKPTMIIAHTFKGKGISSMEWINEFHGRALRKDEMEIALRELS